MPKLPLIKGTGKNYKDADYIDALPVNMLATPKEVIDADSYLRSFPGIDKKADVDGISRGVEFNTHQNKVYRVCGGKIYAGEDEVGDVSGHSRVSMAHSAVSQAVAHQGNMTLYRYDGTEKQLENWPEEVDGVEYSQYEIGSVRDIVRIRGRYIWVKDGTQTFGITDLTDESHPDQYSPFYAAESQPDGIIGCGKWRDFAVMFGSSTIEYFSLTGATTVGAAIYTAQPSLMVQKGIAGTHCKAEFLDSHAFISHPANGAPSVYVISSGQANSISTATIDKILREYTQEELSQGVMETLRFDAHELLIIHLLRHVLVFDGAASAGGAQWSIIKTGLYDDVHQAIDYCYEGSGISCGDKYQARTGKLNFASSAQYDVQQEHLLYTPLIKGDNARLFDFSLEASTGVAQIADKLFLSATTDGITFGQERTIVQNKPFDYNKRVLMRRIGRVRRNIGFKIRIITKSPVTLSDCSVRVQ
nr:packaged DNA stabilization protein [uncultured Vibrio sp.]